MDRVFFNGVATGIPITEGWVVLPKPFIRRNSTAQKKVMKMLKGFESMKWFKQIDWKTESCHEMTYELFSFFLFTMISQFFLFIYLS